MLLSKKTEIIQELVGLTGRNIDGKWGDTTADAILKKLGWEAKLVNTSGAVPVEQIPLDADIALELLSHESIVLELYKDSENINTWGVGVTNASGHSVDRYKDNPQTIQKVLEVYIWLLEKNYIPAVRRAFAGTKLTKAQFAAALSFHYNTGAIEKTDWVKLFKQGKFADVEKFFATKYQNGGDLRKRRKAESDLLLKGKWSNNGTVNVIPVRKPSYQPDFKKSKPVILRSELSKVIKGG